MTGTRDKIGRLDGDALDLLELLPVEPAGQSLAGLADDLFGRRDPATLGRVRRALDRIGQAVGGLYRCRGDGGFGLYDVPLFGLRRRDRPKVARFFGGK